jgi:hypothetical protein
VWVVLGGGAGPARQNEYIVDIAGEESTRNVWTAE